MLNSSSLGFGEVLRAHHFTVVKLKSNILAASVKCVVQRKINIIYISKLGLPIFLANLIDTLTPSATSNLGCHLPPCFKP